MRLVNVFFFVLLAFVLFVLGNLYLTNHDLLIREVVIFGESIKIQSVILLAFLLGFLLNVLYTGIMELVRLVRGLNDSADTRLVKRYNFFVLEVQKAWLDPACKNPQTLHHRGRGVFMVAGEVMRLPSKMK